jgi:hypothetical protein
MQVVAFLPLLSFLLTDVQPPSFEADIRPIFREHCLDCHGASADLEGSLDLRLVRMMVSGGDSGSALVPGHAAESLLWQRVDSGEMPPGEARLTDDQLQLLRQWIDAGCPTLREEPESLPPGIPITEQERAYWAYQPLGRIGISHAEDGSASQGSGDDRIRTPVDTLIALRMPEGLKLSPDADRLTLVRRVYFHLIGLPPTPEQVDFWCSHPEEDWYEQMTEQLLGSPHYGERWARHWLDAAGYADSEGYTPTDADRPWVWRYRDYVVRSLNEDKPFDQFLTEQLAGDELAGARDGDWTAEQVELLTATGFLRLSADGTGSGDNSPEARNRTIADTMQIIGNTLLASSLHCAQCHDHRYDPISQRDYFAVRAVFDPALDWQHWKTPSERLVSLTTAEEARIVAELEAEVNRVAAEKAAKQEQYLQQALEQELAKFEQPLREQLGQAFQTPADQRSPEQVQLLESHPSVQITPGVLYQYLPDAAEDLKSFDARITEIRSRRPADSMIRALVEPAGELPITRLFHRGDHNQPGDPVPPGGLTVLAPEGQAAGFESNCGQLPTSGRRLAFASWLTSSESPNPLFARAIVNRVWLHHFGRGIVESPGDFGRLGNHPTHPELLDWLARYWIDSGWSLKQLHRIILRSSVFRQSSARHPDGDSIDPDNRFYWRRQLIRLDAEALRDSILAVTGQLDRQLYGPPVSIREDESGQVSIDPGQPRRSLYARWRRTQPVAFLQTFDAPVMNVCCDTRPASTVASQALLLMNSEFSLDQASKLAQRIQAMAESRASQRLVAAESPSPEDSRTSDLVTLAWKLVFQRLPSEAELQLADTFAARQKQWLAANPAQLPEGVSAESQVIVNICQTLLGSNEFLYID